jgi:O-antigen/teichoic acid export membrane protein
MSSVFVSNMLVAVSNWLQISLINNKSSLLIVGVFTLSLAISNPIIQFLNLQLRSLLIVDKGQVNKFNSYFSTRAFTTLLIVVIGFLIASVITDDYSHKKIILLIFVTYGIDALIDIFNAYQHAQEKFTILAYSVAYRAISAIVGLSLGYYFFNSIIYGLFFSIVLKIAVLLNDFFIVNKMLNIKIKLFLTREIFVIVKKGFPLGLTLIIASLNVNMSKYFIEYHFGTEVQGAISTMSYLIAIGTLFIAAMGQVFLPKLARLYKTNSSESLKAMNFKYLGSTFLVGVSLIFFSFIWGKSFLELFFSENLLPYAYLFGYIMIAAQFIYLASAQGYSLTSVDLLKHQFYIGLFVLVLNFLLNLIFGKTFGIIGLVLFPGFVFMIQFLMGVYLFNSKLTIK